MCYFKDAAGCTVKVCPYIKDVGKCAKYYKHYLLHMAGEVIPFNYNADAPILSSGIYFSRDLNKSKSCIVKTALNNHARVKRLTLSQVLGSALDSECEIPVAEYYFIESPGKTYGDINKVIGVVQSQLEKMMLYAKCIVVCVPKDPAIRFDFTVIK